MGRVHLFEFEDQRWYPNVLRDLTTDFLRYSANSSKDALYRQVVPVISRGLRESGSTRIIDLASGAGGPYLRLAGPLAEQHPGLQIMLTDYFPNLAAFAHVKNSAGYFDYAPYPVDARQVPATLKGFRTYFLSFHHFKPADAKRILQDALNNNSGIAIFEDQERSWRSARQEAAGPVSLLLHSWRIRPFKWSRLLFTYLLPVLPFTLLWDGLVSCLRTYSEKEMLQLIDQLEHKERFNWETGRLSQGSGMILYLLGTPKAALNTQ
jgi:hypothetical protein